MLHITNLSESKKQQIKPLKSAKTSTQHRFKMAAAEILNGVKQCKIMCKVLDDYETACL